VVVGRVNVEAINSIEPLRRRGRGERQKTNRIEAVFEFAARPQRLGGSFVFSAAQAEWKTPQVGI